MDIKDILSNQSKYDDKDLKKYFGQFVRNIFDKEFKSINKDITIVGGTYPSMLISAIDFDDPKDYMYHLDAYYYIENDGVFVGELVLISEYNKDFDLGYTYLSASRFREYTKEDLYLFFRAEIDTPFDWENTVKKLLTNELVDELLVYPVHD